jgi:hypothetical protein
VILWATLAIVNAIWAAAGDVDGVTVMQVALEGFIFLQLYRAEKKQQAAE